MAVSTSSTQIIPLQRTKNLDDGVESREGEVIGGGGPDENENERDGGGEEAGPDVDDGGRPAPPPHEALGEGVEVRQHPEAEEHPAQQLAPLRDHAVHRADHPHRDRHHVHHDDRDRRHHQRRPLHRVQVRELVVPLLAGRLGGERKRDLHPGDDLQQPLQHRREVRARPPDEPELLVPPPLLEPDPRPPDLERREEEERHGDGEEVGEEGDVERLHDELPREERERREEAVGDEERGGEGVDADVQVRDPLQHLHPGPREERVVPREEDLHGPRRPPEHLLQPVGQVDGRRPAERVAPRGHAVHRPPPPVVHPVPGHHVLRHRPVDPPHPPPPLRLLLVPARHHADALRHHRRVQAPPRDQQSARRPPVLHRRVVPQGPPLELRHRDRLDQEARLPEPSRKGRQVHRAAAVVQVGRPESPSLFRADAADLALFSRVVLFGARRVEAVEGGAAKEAAGSHVDGALKAVEGAHVDVEEDGVVVGVAVRGVDPLEPLRELDVADAVPAAVHHEAHALAERLGVVHVVVAVEVEDERAVGHDGGRADQGVHRPRLLVVVVARPLLAGHVDQHRQADVDILEVDHRLLVVAPAFRRQVTRRPQHHLRGTNKIYSSISS
ncbi:hypothetical protein ACMD2_09841 [Ananas comosus]|uniref:Uncharacterized protein n=1 Tax=Ananas comosus TaxID=4615 RepID=A0A199VK53_ANACO|nr:hypothetical protein ACMD2_09841 [Ananas comosus]